MELTKELVEELFNYDPETGWFTRKTSKGGRFAGTRAGYTNKADGYEYIKIKSKPIQAHWLAWIVKNGSLPIMDIDHVNGIRNDNRIDNLRETTRSLNLHNSSARARSKTGHKGIYFSEKSRNKWIAKVMFNYKNYHIGSFFTLQEAIDARNKFCKNKIGDSYKTS